MFFLSFLKENIILGSDECMLTRADNQPASAAFDKNMQLRISLPKAPARCLNVCFESANQTCSFEEVVR